MDFLTKGKQTFKKNSMLCRCVICLDGYASETHRSFYYASSFRSLGTKYHIQDHQNDVKHILKTIFSKSFVVFSCCIFIY
jgi:hypothetical protein